MKNITENITAAEILAAARTYLGVKWSHQGRSRHGIDCLGYLVVVACDLNVYHGGDLTNYRRQPDGLTLARALAARMTRSPKIPGAVALLSNTSATYPHHVGFITETLGIIHADARHKRAVESSTLPPDLTVRSAWRFPEMVV